MRLIGLEFRIEYIGPGYQRRDEVLLVPMKISLPSSQSTGYVANVRFPCTMHTDRGDLNFGTNDVHPVPPYGEVSVDEYLHDLKHGIRL